MSKTFMVVGGLNREAPYFQGARGIGLSVFGFDPATGGSEWICEERGIDNPTYLSADSRSGCIYANSEVFGWHEGVVTAYRFDPRARRLVYINKQPSLGSIAAHNSLDRRGRHLLVANYGMSAPGEGPDRAIAVYPISADGGLSAPSASLSHSGSGPDRERQERAHPHCVLESPDGRFVIVSDLGLDALFTYAYGLNGSLSSKPVATALFSPGAGPRHFAFHPNGRLALAICELNSCISSLFYDADSGRFDLIDTVSAVPDATGIESRCSDIQIHPNGRFVYGGNRGHDSIAILSIDPASGRLSHISHQPCGGRTPRNLAIDPSGRFLVVANQNSDLCSVFSIDAEAGSLAPTDCDVQIGSPMCVKFMTLAPAKG